jgi:hypothetical protein
MSLSPASWILHSPRRFVVLLTSAFVALTLVGWFVARSAPSPDPVRRAATSLAPTPGAADITLIAKPSGAHEEELLGPAGRRVLVKFLGHYLAPTSRQEIKRLRPLTTDELWAGLAVADPSNMPHGPASATELKSEGPYSGTYVVRLRHGAIEVAVVVEPDGPKVASVEPVQP